MRIRLNLRLLERLLLSSSSIEMQLSCPLNMSSASVSSGDGNVDPNFVD